MKMKEMLLMWKKYLEHKLVFSQDTEFEVYEVNVTEEDVKEAEQNIS